MSPTKIRMWFYGVLLCGVAGYVAYATWMPGTSFSERVGELGVEEQALSKRLQKHVEVLASDVGPRNVERPDEMRQARDYLLGELKSLGRSRGLEPHLEELEHAGEGAQNIILEIPGTVGNEILVVGAHYDSCLDSPGANDNGSGVAVAVELARAFVCHYR